MGLTVTVFFFFEFKSNGKDINSIKNYKLDKPFNLKGKQRNECLIEEQKYGRQMTLTVMQVLMSQI